VIVSSSPLAPRIRLTSAAKEMPTNPMVHINASVKGILWAMDSKFQKLVRYSSVATTAH